MQCDGVVMGAPFIQGSNLLLLPTGLEAGGTHGLPIQGYFAQRT